MSRSPRLVEEVVALRRDRGDRAQVGIEIRVRQRLGAVERRHGAVAPDHRRTVELQVNVGRAGIDRTPQEVVEIHLDPVVGRPRLFL